MSTNFTYLVVGQDLFSIDEYIREQLNSSLHEFANEADSAPPGSIPTRSSFTPAGYMFYTDIQELRGLTSPVDYGSGIEYANGLLENDGTTALQVGLWLNGTSGCHDIVNGDLDRQIQELFKYLVECRAAKIFLRVGYEFDNPSFKYASHPGLYTQAFRYLVKACREQHLTCSRQIVFVWHSWAAGLPGKTTLEDFYPGDRFVDWIGISVFSQFFEKGLSLGSPRSIEQVMDFASQHGKEIMIAESTPFGGIDSMADPWNEWFEPVLSLIQTHNIRMWSYINCDWNVQPMWKGVGFGETRLSTNSSVMKLWKKNVLGNPRFLTTINTSATLPTVEREGDADLMFAGSHAVHAEGQPTLATVVAAAMILLLLLNCVRNLSRTSYRSESRSDTSKSQKEKGNVYGSLSSGALH